ncbi:MAG: hypothetical protein JKY13_03365 [Gammaproteobacteria bacterium]|nr:hypothetical protein [Gammaproteobacteria bacterium]
MYIVFVILGHSSPYCNAKHVAKVVTPQEHDNVVVIIQKFKAAADNLFIWRIKVAIASKAGQYFLCLFDDKDYVAWYSTDGTSCAKSNDEII